MAKGGLLPRAPRLPPALAACARDLRLEDHLVVVAQEVRGDFSGQQAEGVLFEECRIDRARLTGARLHRMQLSDVMVVGSDLSGADLEEASLTRVVFRDCRLSGVLLPRARLRDVTMSGCRVDGANLRMLDAERVRFEDVDLSDAELSGARLSATCMFDCELKGLEISQAALGGTRFHGSSLAGLRGAEYFKDAVIDSTQVHVVALSVLAASGVQVDDEREGPE